MPPPKPPFRRRWWVTVLPGGLTGTGRGSGIGSFQQRGHPTVGPLAFGRRPYSVCELSGARDCWLTFSHCCRNKFSPCAVISWSSSVAKPRDAQLPQSFHQTLLLSRVSFLIHNAFRVLIAVGPLKQEHVIAADSLAFICSASSPAYGHCQLQPHGHLSRSPSSKVMLGIRSGNFLAPLGHSPTCFESNVTGLSIRVLHLAEVAYALFRV